MKKKKTKEEIFEKFTINIIKQYTQIYTRHSNQIKISNCENINNTKNQVLD